MRAIPFLPALCTALLLGAAPLAAQTAAPATAADASVAAAQAGHDEGTVAARSQGAGMWTLTGFGGSLVLGPVGLGLTRALAGSSATAIPETLQEEVGSHGDAYQLAFQKAYSHELSSRRRSAALAGGIAGTVLFIAAGTVAYTMMK